MYWNGNHLATTKHYHGRNIRATISYQGNGYYQCKIRGKILVDSHNFHRPEDAKVWCDRLIENLGENYDKLCKLPG